MPATTPILWLMHGIGYVVDMILIVPSYVLQRPWQIRKANNRIKGKPLDDDPTKPWRSADHFDSLTVTPFEGVRTLKDLFVYSVKRYRDEPILGTRELLSCEDEPQSNGRVFKKLILGEYKWLTFADVETRVDNIGQGLAKLSLLPGDRVCIFMETRAEWLLTAFACFKYNFQVVTIYATLGEEGMLHGINEAEAKVVVTSAELLPKLQKNHMKMAKLRYAVYCPSFTVTDPASELGAALKLYTLAKLETMKSMSKDSLKENRTRSEDVAVIMYTSGTTGQPKGVMLTHGNILAALSGQCQRILGLSTNDRYLAYLPLAHVLELTAELGCFCFGARMGYSSPGTITDQSSMIKKGSVGDATKLKPTLIACVPTVMDRIYKTILDKVKNSGAIANLVFQFAWYYKERNYAWGYNTPLTDDLVFRKIRQVLGGEVRLMMCGSAPLNADTQRFMQMVFGCSVGQGYGLTETGGAGTVQEVADKSVSRVGHPVWCSQILMRDWEEGGYTVSGGSNKPQGELLVGGANIAKGYYKQPEKTQEEFITIEGIRYFCTGDIGEFQPDGCMKIIDRKKDLVKLQNGEYVSLGKVECALKTVPVVDNICIFGDSYQDYVVALLQPNVAQLQKLAKQLNLDEASIEELCEKPQLLKHVQELLQKQAKSANLEKSEIPRKVAFTLEPWTPENNLLSDTLKLKRKVIEKKFLKEIEAMYSSG